MSAAEDHRESGRDQLARHQASINYEEARSGGNWIVLSGFLIAILWLGGGTAAALLAVPEHDLNAIPLPVLVAGAIGMFIPAFLIIMSSFLARTNHRTAAANALLMQAATNLLAPAREAGTEGINLAEQMKQSAHEVDRAMTHALSNMKVMAGEIGDERMRLESVALASADNARDLTERLGQERVALEGLARELRGQMATMNDAIPRQAQLMVEAARRAGEEVAAADVALEQRLSTLQSASDVLATKLSSLDGMSMDAARRTETLTMAVGRVEEKLEQSKRTVDEAVRAGEVAAAAASNTGESLQSAVTAALESARKANDYINAQTRAAAEEATRALEQLRAARDEAVRAIDSAVSSPPPVQPEAAPTDATPHVTPTPAPTPPLPTPAPVAAPISQPQAPPQELRTDRLDTPSNPVPAPSPERHVNGVHLNGQSTSRLLNAEERQEHERAVDATIFDTPSPMPAPASPSVAAEPVSIEPIAGPSAPVGASDVDDDLFDASADSLASAALGEDSSAETDEEPMILRRRKDDPPLELNQPAPHPMRRATDLVAQPAEPPAEAPTVVTPPINGATGNLGWKDIISDMSRDDDDPAQLAMKDREEVADMLINRLQGSGIALPEMFKPKAKRKIAEAARKGEVQRRTAILQNAGKQVERVTMRLRNDDELRDLARDFMEMEEADALMALEQTQKTSRNASSRLAAYLLLDAAI